MNNKILVFVLFAVWCVICQRWYVCGIKEACAPPSAQASTDVIQTPAIEPDTVTTIDLSGDSESQETASKVAENQPVAPNSTPKPSAPQKNGAAANADAKPKPQPLNPNAYNQVQMEEVANKMTIYFPYNSTRREDNHAIAAYLQQLAERLKSSGEKVTITGHTDFVGEPADNMKFGLERANSIKNTLIKNGVSPKQIRTKSFGDTKPISTNDTPQGRYRNRRAELRIEK